MLIRHKLLLSAAVSIGALVLMFALQQYSSSVQTELSIAIQKVVELDKEVLSMRKNEKDFLAARISSMSRYISRKHRPRRS